MNDLYGWLLSFSFLVFLLGIVSYQLMCFADLESDFRGPYDTTKRLNGVAMPEFVTQALLSITYLITGHWFLCLLCLPYSYHNVKSYVERGHLADVTEIYSHMHRGRRRSTHKLIYLVALLSLSLFWLIWTAQDNTT